MEYIAFGLKSNGNISTLDLSCNEFTSLGIQVFLNAVQQEAVLTSKSLILAIMTHKGTTGYSR